MAASRVLEAADLVLAWDKAGRSAWQFPHAAHGIQIRETSHAGMGAFALHALSPGERVLAERPLLDWSKDRGDTTSALEAAVAEPDRDSTTSDRDEDGYQ